MTSGEALWQEDFDYLFGDPDGRSWRDEPPKDTEASAPTSTKQPEVFSPNLIDHTGGSPDHWADSQPTSPLNPELRRGTVGANVFGAPPRSQLDPAPGAVPGIAERGLSLGS